MSLCDSDSCLWINVLVSYTNKHMRPIQKVSDLGQGKQSSVSGWLQYLIPFKVGRLWLHTLSRAVLPSLEALLKGLFYSILCDVLAAVWEPFRWVFSLGTSQEPAKWRAWPGNPGLGVMKELGRCHDAAASCVSPTAPVFCAELCHKEDGGCLGSTPYWQFGIVVSTHHAQYPGNQN
jgi:hypothetical protein